MELSAELGYTTCCRCWLAKAANVAVALQRRQLHRAVVPTLGLVKLKRAILAYAIILPGHGTLNAQAERIVPYVSPGPVSASRQGS